MPEALESGRVQIQGFILFFFFSVSARALLAVKFY